MEAISYIVPAQFAYLSIPTKGLRDFADGLFPSLAKCSIADAASGKYHRYMAGHDLVLDVFSTARNSGVRDALHQAGHIALTDFPTKAGIPIPFFSKSGLGEWLVNSAGISRGWLSINICDAGIGIYAIAEASPKLLAALNGELPMTAWTFFDTFVTGAIEIVIGYSTKNPLLVIAGVENVLAGIVSTWREYSVAISVNPLSFLGAGLLSASLGFLIGYTLLGESLSESLLDALKSGVIGALFTISAGCGFGAILGFAAFSFGKALARGGEGTKIAISQESLALLMREITEADPDIEKIIATAKTSLFMVDNADSCYKDAIPGLFMDRNECLCMQGNSGENVFIIDSEEQLFRYFKEAYVLNNSQCALFSPDTSKLVYTQ